MCTHLADVLQEGEVQVLILQPRQLQVAIHVCAIDEAIPKVAIMVVSVGGHRHTPRGADANCGRRGEGGVISMAGYVWWRRGKMKEGEGVSTVRYMEKGGENGVRGTARWREVGRGKGKRLLSKALQGKTEG